MRMCGILVGLECDGCITVVPQSASAGFQVFGNHDAEADLTRAAILELDQCVTCCTL